MDELTSIDIQTGVNESGKGFCTVIAHSDRKMFLGQLPPSEVRTMAMNFLEAAEAAETDAIIYRLLQDKFHLELPIVAAFVNDMRDLRDQGD